MVICISQITSRWAAASDTGHARAILTDGRKRESHRYYANKRVGDLVSDFHGQARKRKGTGEGEWKRGGGGEWGRR